MATKQKGQFLASILAWAAGGTFNQRGFGEVQKMIGCSTLASSGGILGGKRGNMETFAWGNRAKTSSLVVVWVVWVFWGSLGIARAI